MDNFVPLPACGEHPAEPEHRVSAPHTNGHTNGYSNGYSNSHTNGYSNGFSNSHTNGYSNGYSNGYTDSNPNTPADKPPGPPAQLLRHRSASG